MKSPFPGMDPYLESHWLDVHARLVLYTCDALQPQLTAGLRARVEERLIVEADDYERLVYPDVRVVRSGREDDRPIRPLTGVALAEPLRITVPHEERSETFIRIIDTAKGNELVTVIEYLSATNKTRGAKLEQYRRKQNEFLGAKASLVEIDLLREGERAFHSAQIYIPPQNRQAYAACVRRGYASDSYEIYPMSLRERLPAFAIPLRKGDPDVVLDLQSVVNQAYENGAYDDIDYTRPPEPPLAQDDEKWADELLRGKGLR